MNIVGFDDVRFEAASELAKIYEQTGGSNNAKTLLQRAIELSRQNVFWHCRLLFQTAVSTVGPMILYLYIWHLSMNAGLADH